MSKKSKEGSASLKALTRRKQVFKPILDVPESSDHVWEAVDDKRGLELSDQLVKTLQSIPNKNKNDNLCIGFNCTNKRLEDQAKLIRKKKPVANAINVVFICYQDIKPKLIIEHMPILCVMAKSETIAMKLVPLPQGTREKLSEVMGTSGTILGISDKLVAEFPELEKLLAGIKQISLPWIEKQKLNAKPVIKFLKTSAPIQQQKQKQTQKSS